MPTTLRSFPQVNRSGTQQTAYALIPAGIDVVQLQGVASDATFSDEANAITFIVLSSPTGQDSDSREMQREYWTGGTFFNKTTQQIEPRRLDVAFTLPGRARGHRIALRAIFNRTITIGADLIGLP